MTVLISCQTNTKQAAEIKNKDVQNLHDIGEYKLDWSVKADESVNKTEFAKYYHQNPMRWALAFKFLASTNLETIQVGRYNLDGENLFANVDQYQTKDEKNTRFESHRRYADIQYLIKGKEYIGVVSLLKMQNITVPYSNEKDIAFYSSEENNYRLADSSRFFIFFPDDAHRPCMKVDDNIMVKKIVIKVALD